ncbi:MAG: polyprenyl synthetase family protein [Candidatus Kapabacteria bacterium]|nr:polyprenyl synthetase family protein [Ignavibacteriota bacterium]MCW5886052.1 polyprenyl synthetase family protein [Candidatus Kapabacteria bacterium]
MILSEITDPVLGHLEKFNTYFKALLQTKVSLLNLILKYVTSKKGKQLRPVLVFLSAQASGGISQRTYNGAALVELLHTATLIHDDVVDEASERRGLASINAKWNNKIAVLVGDYLLSKGLISAIDAGETEFLSVTSKAVKRMSEGELMSIDKSRSISFDEDTYFRIISDKTASLLSTCCEIGALSASNNIEYREAMREYGESIGIAFQIRDDIFDYTSRSSLIGKPVGNDLKEKKITLPLIHALGNSIDKEKNSILKLIKRGKLKKAEVNLIIDFVHEKKGIEYAEKIAKEYISKAQNALGVFPESPAKESLLRFTEFVLTRDS